MKLKNEFFKCAARYVYVVVFVVSAGCAKANFNTSSDTIASSTDTGTGTGAKMYSESHTFNTIPYSGKVDILFVVDNSSSMLQLQNNMTANFTSFIKSFVDKNFDYHLAVTSSEAYLSLPQFNNDPSFAQFRDGVSPDLSGTFIITPATPHPEMVFATNATLGPSGSGDERAFSSLKATLDSPLNAGFLRPDSFLAVVILSDEDDFHDPTRAEYSYLPTNSAPDHDYLDPNLESVDSYISYLDGLTGTTGSSRRYSVSGMSVLDPICRAQHVSSGALTSIIGQRYIEMTNKTGGELGSICDENFGEELSNIADRVIRHTQPTMPLSAVPIPGTVKVTVTPADPALTWELSGQTLNFNKWPAIGTTVTVDYQGL